MFSLYRGTQIGSFEVKESDVLGRDTLIFKTQKCKNATFRNCHGFDAITH